ncbi:hypothetical protein Holit_02280 [Hollandina sp. SP2]
MPWKIQQEEEIWEKRRGNPAGISEITYKKQRKKFTKRKTDLWNNKLFENRDFFYNLSVAPEFFSC